MKIILTILFYLTTLIVCAQSKDLFYKTVDSKHAKDSILNNLKSENLEFVEFSKPCYWETRDSLNINYCDSYLIVYQDSFGVSQTILLTEFFIYLKKSTNPIYEYYRWNKSELLQTHLRPDDSDLTRRAVDTSIMQDLGYQVGDTLSFLDSIMVTSIGPGFRHYTIGKDGLPSQIITISTKDTLRRIVIDQYVLSPSNYYYRYNCKKPIYTLRILLEQEFESMKESVEFHLEMKEFGLLDSLGQLDISSNPEYFEKMYEEQINNWIEEANYELNTNWKLKKNKKTGTNKK